MNGSLIEPPEHSSAVRFASEFGQRSLLTVDTEEEFDWEGPFHADRHSLHHIPKLARFQTFCEGLGVVPTYLIDWPVATSAEAVEVLSGPVKAGKAEIGVQLHPWVNPPFNEEVNAHNSYAGNLPPELEREKLRRLRDRIEDAFGTAPLIYRAGRYGLGKHTAGFLREAGIAVDSSVRANFDYRRGHGPDYRKHPLHPYWVDDERTLLELPLTTVFSGTLRKQGRLVYPILGEIRRTRGIAASLRLLERIPLTPEGISVAEAIRGIDIAVDDKLPLLVLSFHSPSLAPGHTPYVRNEYDLNRLYDWWRRIYAYMDQRGVKPTTVAETLAAARG